MRAGSGGIVAGVAAGVLVLAGCEGGAAAPARQAEAVPSRPVVSASPDGRDAADALGHARWTRLPDPPGGQSVGPVIVWDGTELLAVGGARSVMSRPPGTVPPGSPERPTATVSPATSAGAFDPVARPWWRDLAPAPFAVVAGAAHAVWTGQALFVLTDTGRAALLDPAANRWTPVDRPPLTLPGTLAVTASHGHAVVVDQPGDGERAAPTQVAILDGGTNTWQRADPPAVRGHDQQFPAVLGVGDDVVLWSMWSRQEALSPNSVAMHAGVDVFRLSAGSWRTVTGAWPQGQGVNDPMAAGSQLVVPPAQVWCGRLCSHPAPLGAQGHLVDARTLATTALPHGPLDDLGPRYVWTGRALLALAPTGMSRAADGTTTGPADGAVWDPASSRWTRLPAAPADLDGGVAPVWGAHRAFVLTVGGSVLMLGAPLGTGG